MSSILNRVANYQHQLQIRQNNFKSIVGIVQVCATEDVDLNYEKCRTFVEECADKGAQMVCLPEHFAYMNENTESAIKSFNFDESLNQKLFKKYRQLALDNQVWLSLGCYPERDEKNKKNYLTHFILNSEGNVVSHYRKMHMFDVHLRKQGGVNQRESETFSTGDKITEPCYSPIGHLGLSISYDLRFPELFR